MRSRLHSLVREAATQLAGEGQIDLFLYAQIEDAGFEVNAVVDAAERYNTFVFPN